MRRRWSLILLLLLFPALGTASSMVFLLFQSSADDSFELRIRQDPFVGLTDSNVDVRISSAHQLAQIAELEGPGLSQSLPAFAQALRDPHPSVRRLAGESLRWIGRIGVDELVLALEDRRSEVRISAAKMLLWQPSSKITEYQYTSHDKHDLARKVLKESRETHE